MNPLSPERIGDLIVIFDKRHEARGMQIETGRTTALFLPFVALALVKETPLGERNKFLRGAAIVAVVRFIFTGQSHNCTVMKIIIPESVQTVAPQLWRAN